MTSETSQLGTALPIRRRETLEIFDTALKLYRRYFWVLTGWSAIVAVMSFVPYLNIFSLFVSPLLYGAVSCCVAAAVRGQKVTFQQCWNFSKPRYGPILGTTLLSWLIIMGVLIVFYIAIVLIAVAGYYALQSAPAPITIVSAVVGVILAIIGFSGLSVVTFSWAYMVPIVVCLEDDKRGTAALGRSYELLKGNWGRVFGMSLIIGLAALAMMAILMGMASLFSVFRWSEIFSPNPSEDAILGMFFTFSAFMAFFVLFWNPAQSLIIAVLYLDLRVRREALDLEWTTYASAPAVPPPPPAAAFDAPGYGGAFQPPVGQPTSPSLLTSTPQPVSEISPTSFSAGSGAVENVPVQTPVPFESPTPFELGQQAPVQIPAPREDGPVFLPVTPPPPVAGPTPEGDQPEAGRE